MLEEKETVQRMHVGLDQMKSGKSTSKFKTDALKPSTKQKLTILNRNRRISPQRLMVATAGGQKQKGLQRLPARKALFPTSRAQAAVDMPRRATMKPTFLRTEFFAQQCTEQGKSVGIEQGAPFPLLESHPVFTLPPIPEELVLRKLLRLRVHKVDWRLSSVQSISKKMCTFSGQLYHPPLQPLPDNLLLSERFETCQSHPSLQKTRLPIRSL